MNSYVLFAVVILYLALLFLVAHHAEKKKSKIWVNNPFSLLNKRIIGALNKINNPKLRRISFCSCLFFIVNFKTTQNKI